jgi:hypothetical protein
MPLMAVPRPANLRQNVSMAGEGCDLGLDGLRQQRSCAITKHLDQWIGKSSWLRKLKNVSLGSRRYHSFAGELGGFEHLNDTPPYPFMPSPTFAHSF